MLPWRKFNCFGMGKAFTLFLFLVVFCCPSNSAASENQCSHELNFNVELNTHETGTYHKYIKRYRHDSQLRKNFYKHQSDFNWIRHQLASHGLPPDFAYIIVVESTMNPKLISGKYHGIWQMSGYHCRGNDIKCLYSYRESTKYAIKYLLELKKIFHNNHRYMIYGYNCGYGKIQRIMKHHGGKVPYHSLPLITRMYIPKMLAAKHVLENIFPSARFKGNECSVMMQ